MLEAKETEKISLLKKFESKFWRFVSVTQSKKRRRKRKRKNNNVYIHLLLNVARRVTLN